MAKPKCTAKTKRGTRCKASPLKGTDRCSAHPLKPGSARYFGHPEQAREAGQQGGRPRKPRAVDVLRERIEADIDRWLQPLEDGLTAQRAVVVGDGPTAHLEFFEDIPTQIKAHREAFDRAFGRPTQPTRDDSLDDIDSEIREMLSEMRRRDPEGKDVAHANGNGRAPH
jgi:hypothetical protein